MAGRLHDLTFICDPGCRVLDQGALQAQGAVVQRAALAGPDAIVSLRPKASEGGIVSLAVVDCAAGHVQEGLQKCASTYLPCFWPSRSAAPCVSTAPAACLHQLDCLLLAGWCTLRADSSWSAAPQHQS